MLEKQTYNVIITINEIKRLALLFIITVGWDHQYLFFIVEMTVCQ